MCLSNRNDLKTHEYNVNNKVLKLNQYSNFI